MKLTKYSENRLNETFVHWSVPRDYADPMFNYLVHGFEPGSFFTSVLANDFVGAIQHSHPANSIPALKALVGWLQSVCPAHARGSYEDVKNWCQLDAGIRRKFLECNDLVYTEQQEIMMALKNERTVEPMFWD